MTTQGQHSSSHRIVRGRTPYVLSIILLVAAIAGAAPTLVLPDVLSGPAVANGNARGTALVMLVVAVPSLGLSAAFAARGSARAVGVWIGSVAYLLYQAVLFLFATPFNALFLSYVLLAGSAIWSLLLLAIRADVTAFFRRVDERMPVRALSGYAAVIALANAAVWLAGILPAIVSEHPSSFLEGSGMTTNPVYVQDLAFWIPLVLVSAWFMWRRRPTGILATGALLAMLLMESIGVATDQWMGATADPTTPFASFAAVPLFAGLSIMGAVAVFFYFRNIDRRPLATTTRS